MMKRALSKEEAWARAERMCSASEYSLWEMRRKLASWGVTSRDAREILEYLVDERYIDDARFARNYAAEKLEQSRWGARKIYASLRAKGIDHDTTQEALGELDSELYDRVMVELIEAKVAAVGGDDGSPRPAPKGLTYPEKVKIARFMGQRGFDPSTTMKLLNNV